LLYIWNTGSSSQVHDTQVSSRFVIYLNYRFSTSSPRLQTYHDRHQVLFLERSSPGSSNIPSSALWFLPFLGQIARSHLHTKHISGTFCTYSAQPRFFATPLYNWNTSSLFLFLARSPFRAPTTAYRFAISSVFGHIEFDFLHTFAPSLQVPLFSTKSYFHYRFSVSVSYEVSFQISSFLAPSLSGSLHKTPFAISSVFRAYLRLFLSRSTGWLHDYRNLLLLDLFSTSRLQPISLCLVSVSYEVSISRSDHSPSLCDFFRVFEFGFLHTFEPLSSSSTFKFQVSSKFFLFSGPPHIDSSLFTTSLALSTSLFESFSIFWAYRFWFSAYLRTNLFKFLLLSTRSTFKFRVFSTSFYFLGIPSNCLLSSFKSPRDFFLISVPWIKWFLFLALKIKGCVPRSPPTVIVLQLYFL